MANDKLIKVAQPGALAVPDFIAVGDKRGHEGIEQGDLILPRLAVAQPTSPELQKGDPKYIPGLAAGDMFNTVTRESYGEGPVRVVIVRREKPRAMLFASAEEGGGIIERDIPLTDPRCDFVGNKRPEATVFREYIALLADTLDPIALSFKGTSLNSARMLNTLLEMPFKGQPVAYFGRVYQITTALKKNTELNAAYYVFGVTHTPGDWPTREAYGIAEATYESMAGKALAVDDSNPDTERAEKEPF